VSDGGIGPSPAASTPRRAVLDRWIALPGTVQCFAEQQDGPARELQVDSRTAVGSPA
jgi:hypothetical protein